MRFRRFEDRYIVRIERDEPLKETLLAFLRSEDVEFANLSAVGAVRSVRLGYWNAETRAYEYRDVEENMEVVSFQGKASRKDGQPTCTYMACSAAGTSRSWAVMWRRPGCTPHSKSGCARKTFTSAVSRMTTVGLTFSTCPCPSNTRAKDLPGTGRT